VLSEQQSFRLGSLFFYILIGSAVAAYGSAIRVNAILDTFIMFVLHNVGDSITLSHA